MGTNLYLVRHAHSVYTPDERNRPLSERGCLDAKKVTELLKRKNVDHVISSPYRRAIQTVEGIAHSIGKAVEIEEGFKERILSDKPVEDFQYAVARVWEDEHSGNNFPCPISTDCHLTAQNCGRSAGCGKADKTGTCGKRFAPSVPKQPPCIRRLYERQAVLTWAGARAAPSACAAAKFPGCLPCACRQRLCCSSGR